MWSVVLRHLVVMFGVMIVNLAAIAEDHGTNQPAGGTTRPPANGALTEDEKRKIANHFGLPEATIAFLGNDKKANGQVNELYLPGAFEKVMRAIPERDESGTANIMANLFGALNDNEAVALLKRVETEKRELESADPEKRQRYTHIVDRIFWAAKVVAQDYLGNRQDLTPEQKEEAKTEAAAKFNPLFKEAFRKIQDANKALKARAEELASRTAANPRAQDVAALRGALTQDEFQRGMLASLLTRQFKTGSEQDKQFATNLAKALGWMDQDGRFFMDFEGQGGEKQRVHLGQSAEEVQRALGAMDSRFNNTRLATAAHSSPDSGQEFVVSNGNLVQGRPAGFRPVQNNNNNNNNNNNTGFNPAVVVRVCSVCHAVTTNNATNVNDFRMSAKGVNNMTLKQALQLMDNKFSIEADVARRNLSQELANVRAWAAQIR